MPFKNSIRLPICLSLEKKSDFPILFQQPEGPQNEGNVDPDCVCISYSGPSLPNPTGPQALLEALQRPIICNEVVVKSESTRANFQVDYVSYLIPGLQDIFSCPFYWGKMDRYEAEALLANKPEGSFLLRDSAQDNYVFSVSFRRYSRSLHARIEETRHKFSFDCHDPGVYASQSIRGLLDHYKDPLSCMFFEPMLLFPILRKKPFTLQELARNVICDSTSYDGVSTLPIPKTLKSFLREYHYKHKVESRALELNSSRIPMTSSKEQ